MTSAHREAIRTARSIVVKVGTTALTTPSGVFDVGRLATLADAIESRMEAGSDVVIVSSGAIAAGIEPLKLSKKPADLATKQAAASVGQVALVNAWNSAFARYDRTVGQVLLTAHDISMRVQHTNAQRTLDRLRALHAVADRQRERHGRHQRDPVRRQRPALRPGRPSGRGRRAGAAVGHRRSLRLRSAKSARNRRGALHLRGIRAGGPRWRRGGPGQSPGYRRDGVEAVFGAVGRRRGCAGAAGRGVRRRYRARRRVGGHGVRAAPRTHVGAQVLGPLRRGGIRGAHARRRCGAGGRPAASVTSSRGHHRGVGPVLRR